MSKNTAPVRGTKDYLPQEMAMREEVKATILRSYKSFGFMQIGTPVLEDIDNLLGSDGGENLKLIFKVLKRGEKLNLDMPHPRERDLVDIGLKYDQTVPLARMYANNQNNLPSPFKAIQIDYSFRADRPQLGRSRQFTQCDIDILGDASSNAEIDIINTTAKTFEALGFDGIVVKLNDRRILSDLIKNVGFDVEQEKEVCICLDKLDKLGFDGVLDELNSRNFCRDDSDTVNYKALSERLINNVMNIKNAGSDFGYVLLKLGVRPDVVKSVQTILDSVNALATEKFKAEFDISIVRGQNYYTGLVYEFYLPGISGACAGGGRYDGMIGKMSGKPVPAVGLGLGFEPTCIAYEQNNLYHKSTQALAVMYGQDDDFVEVLKYVQSINSQGIASAILAKKNLSHQLEVLKQNGFTHFCMFNNKVIKEI